MTLAELPADPRRRKSELALEALHEFQERLAGQGWNLVPHIAARMVRDKSHLQEILNRLDAANIHSVFVPGGDATEPAGIYDCSLDMLRDKPLSAPLRVAANNTRVALRLLGDVASISMETLDDLGRVNRERQDRVRMLDRSRNDH